MSRTATHLAGPAAVAALVLAAATAPTAAQASGAPSRLATIAPEQFQARTQVIDDHLEAETLISTEKAFRTRRGIFDTGWSDNHLRAVIDKRTGAVRFEVRQTLKYAGSFRGYDQVNYQTSAWPLSAAVTKLRDNRVGCSQIEAAEICAEDVTFPVDEKHLRDVAARYDPAAPGQWAFKFKAGDAFEHRTGIVHAEVVALLRVVDDYKRGLTHLNAMGGPAAGPG